MSEVDPLLLAMTSSGLIDDDNKVEGEKMSRDRRSSPSPDVCDDSKESEVSSPQPLSSPLSTKTEECDMSSEFRTVRLKRPNATAVGGLVEKRRKPNQEDFKNPESYFLNSGVLKDIFDGQFSDYEPIMVQVSYCFLKSPHMLTVFFLDDNEREDEGQETPYCSLRWKVHD